MRPFTFLYISAYKSVTNNLRGSSSLDNFFYVPLPNSLTILWKKSYSKENWSTCQKRPPPVSPKSNFTYFFCLFVCFEGNIKYYMSSRRKLFNKKEDLYKISYISEDNTRYEVFYEYICRLRFTFRIVALSKYFLSSYSLEHLVLSTSGIKRLGLVFWKLCRKVIKSFNKAIFLWGICISNVLFCNLERILLFFLEC